MSRDFALAFDYLLKGSKARRRSWPNTSYYIHKVGNTLQGRDGEWYSPSQDDLFADDWEVFIPPPTVRIGNFQCALPALKNGAKVRRLTWPASAYVRATMCPVELLYHSAERDCTASARRWIPDTTDLFADDWYIIEQS